MRWTGASEPSSTLRAYLVSAVAVALACGLGLAIDAWIRPPNISMVFLAAVLFSAIRHGLWPSLFASLLSTLLYNLLFLEPRYSLTIDDPSNVVALVFLLIVAVLTSDLTARLKRTAERARAHAEANAALYEFSAKIARIGRLGATIHGWWIHHRGIVRPRLRGGIIQPWVALLRDVVASAAGAAGRPHQARRDERARPPPSALHMPLTP